MSLSKINGPAIIAGNINFESEFRPNIPYNNNDLYVSKVINESDNS